MNSLEYVRGMFTGMHQDAMNMSVKQLAENMAAQLDAAGEKTVEVTISWFAGVFEALGIKTKTITAFAKVIAGRIPAPTTKELEMRGKEVRKAEAAAKPTAISIFRRRG